MGVRSYLGLAADRTKQETEQMNEYGHSEPTDQPGPVEGPAQQPAPTWQWTGTPPPSVPQYGAYPPPMPPWVQMPPPMPPVAQQSGHPWKTRVLGAAAAVLLVGGAAAGGAAFGFAHGNDGASASGIASGDSGVTAPTVPGQGNGPSAQAPSNGSGNGNGNGSGQTPRQRGGGRPSSYTPPGKATPDQRVGVVMINTRLKYEGAKAAGTGMILSGDGEILTNNHVVEGATTIKVTVVSTGRVYAATVVGTDKVDDVAVIQLTRASGLSTITPDSDGVQVGDAVTAVGNAMGLGGIPSAADGNVVGLNRSITTQSEEGVEGERLTGMIQVDAQVIAGDSGGPLYDAQDEVIGMDTAASSSPMQSVGFAIPIAKAVSIASQIESGQEGGNITLGVPGFLGVEFRPGTSGNGAAVAGVLPGTPAAAAGIISGDRITGLSGAAVTSGDQLRTLLSQHHGGDSVSLTWTDSQGGSHTASVTLIAGPAELGGRDPAPAASAPEGWVTRPSAV